MLKLYIVRHEKTNWNDKGLLQGSTDIEINDKGIKQAEKLSKNIDLEKIDICLCSLLKRARKTAEILVGNKKKNVYDDYVDHYAKEEQLYFLPDKVIIRLTNTKE